MSAFPEGFAGIVPWHLLPHAVEFPRPPRDEARKVGDTEEFASGQMHDF